MSSLAAAAPMLCAPSRMVTLRGGMEARLGAAGDTLCLSLSGADKGGACVPFPPLHSRVALFGHAAVDATGERVLVWTPTDVCVIDASEAVAGRQDWLSPPAPSTRTLITGEDLVEDGDCVVSVRWHPLAYRLVVVLTRQRMLTFDVTEPRCVPCDDVLLPFRPAPSRHVPTPHPASFAFGGARGWELLSLFLVYSDGAVFCIAPWLPRGALLLQPDWAALRFDAHTAITHAEAAAHEGGHSLYAPNLDLEWLDACFVAVEGGGGGEVSGAAASTTRPHPHPSYVQYTGPPERHALLGPAAAVQWVPALQGPARVHPSLASMSRVVDVHVAPHSVAGLPMLTLLHEDGKLTTVVATSHVVPAWNRHTEQRGSDGGSGRSHVNSSTAIVAAYASRQVSLSPQPWGQQLPAGGKSGEVHPAGPWLVLSTLQLPLCTPPLGGASAESALLQAARAHVTAGRGTVPGGHGACGVAEVKQALRAGGQGSAGDSDNHDVRNVDVVAAPFFFECGGALPLPGGLLVVCRHSVLLVNTPHLSFDSDSMDALEPGAHASHVLAGWGAEGSPPLTVFDLTSNTHTADAASSPDVCGVAVVPGSGVHVWITGAGQSVQLPASASPLDVQRNGAIQPYHFTQGTVLLDDSVELDDVSARREAVMDPSAFQSTRPFEPEVQHEVVLMKNACDEVIRVVRETAGEGWVGPQGSAATTTTTTSSRAGEGQERAAAALARLGTVSQHVLKTLGHVQVVQRLVSNRVHLLSSVSAEVLLLAQDLTLVTAADSALARSSASMARADALRSGANAQLSRLHALESRVARIPHSGGGAAHAPSSPSDASLVRAGDELGCILRELSGRCRADAAAMEGTLTRVLRRLTSNAAGVPVGGGGEGVAASVQEVRGYLHEVHARLEAIRTQQAGVALAVATLHEAVEEAGRAAPHEHGVALGTPVRPAPPPSAAGASPGRVLRLSTPLLQPRAAAPGTGPRQSRAARSGLPVATA